MKPESHYVIKQVLLHFEKYVEVEDLSKVDKNDVRSYLYAMQEQRNWKVKTFLNKLQYLKTFFDFCIEYRYIKTNPVLGIKKPKLPKPSPRYLTTEKLLQVMNSIRWHDWKGAFESERNEALVAFAAMTGLRNREICDLKISDIDLTEGWIFVKLGKGDKPRYVPVPPKLPDVLRRWYMVRQAHGLHSEYLFVGVRNKNRLSVQAVVDIFRKISKISGIYISCHMLRHSYGFACSNSGVNPRAVQKAMGHSCIRTTMRYSEISPQAVKEQISEASFF